MTAQTKSNPNAYRESRDLFLIGAVLFLLVGLFWHPVANQKFVDFRAYYFASTALLNHYDPYSPGGVFQHDAPTQSGYKPIEATDICVNLPSTLALLVPFALLPLAVAQYLWAAITAASFLFAAWLVWRIGLSWSPRAAGVLSFLFVAGSPILLEVANAAGIAVSFAAIAALAIVYDRHARAGVMLLALSLLLKPQDAGFVWLYFLLAGGPYRRRALETLGVVAVVFVAATAWIQHVSPHWMTELQANLISTSLPAHVNDPSPLGPDPGGFGSLTISLQTLSSIFFPSPATYNLIAYLLCAPLLATWAWTALRAQRTLENALLALAAIAPLSMLPVYHRQHDTRLMILAIPACALLWSKRDKAGHGKAGKWAFGITALTAILSCNIVMQLLGIASYNLRLTAVGFRKEILTFALARPIPILMLLMATFFCCYWAREVFASQPLWTAELPQPEAE